MSYRNLWCAIAFSVCTALAGCSMIESFGNDAPTGRVVAVTLFKGDTEPLLRETIQDTFIDVFFKTTNGRPVKGETGDIVLVGTISFQTGDSERKSSVSAGTYVSGITVQAYENGELIATHSVGQDLGRGVLFSPVSLANQAARFLAKTLIRRNEIGPR